MIFLYQSFYCDLPKKNDTFAADLDDLFPQGVYDTKYLAEFHQSMPATYLEYLFKKMWVSLIDYGTVLMSPVSSSMKWKGKEETVDYLSGHLTLSLIVILLLTFSKVNH